MEHIVGTGTSMQAVRIPVAVSHGANSELNQDLMSCIPANKAQFHRFPESQGWTINAEFQLNTIGAEHAGEAASFEVLLQQWLFFGVVQTIVQKEGRHLLSYADLCTERGCLTTGKLNAAVEEWVDWETRTPKGRSWRLIQNARVLETARGVVRRNCTCRFPMSPRAGHPDTDSRDTDLERSYVQANLTRSRTDFPRLMKDETALALMLVGECLWAAHMRIVRQCTEKLSGWHGDSDAGWGPPAYALQRMMEEKWCPRIIQLLKGQLRSNATLLMHAWSVYKGTPRMTEGHEECSGSTCQIESSTFESGGPAQCLNDGMCETTCRFDGPDAAKVREILGQRHPATKANQIPLVRFVSEPNALVPKLEVLSLDTNSGKLFATISHVWADGWGNDESNQLLVCQLRFIQRQLRQLPIAKTKRGGVVDIPFWMDTLVIPASKTALNPPSVRELRTIAIKQIFQVYASSSCTIVLDKGLCAVHTEDHAVDDAMRLLASGWMRRLWTLHEAFLSVKQYVAFREWPENCRSHLVDLKDLLEQLHTAEAQKSPLHFWMRELLLQNIMQEERSGLSASDRNLSTSQVAMCVSAAWRAARWRTTSNLSHEALALATLLNVNYDGTQIESANWQADGQKPIPEELIRTFWREFHATYLNCIPPGIIFLPGDKLSFRGYGWAPKSWMSAHEVDFPDPMSTWTAETDLLEDKGLIVEYPGYLLFAETDDLRHRILNYDRAKSEDGFTFAADNTFLEWYTVKAADPDMTHRKDCQRLENNQNPLAIILSRPQPKAAPAEIGLLVEIYRTDNERTSSRGKGHPTQRYRCHRIMRVHVHRETRTEYHSIQGNNRPPATSDLSSCPAWDIISGDHSNASPKYSVGQYLPPTQKWVVDSYFRPESQAYATPQTPYRKSSGTTSISPSGTVARDPKAPPISSSVGNANLTSPTDAPSRTATRDSSIGQPIAEPIQRDIAGRWRRVARIIRLLV
ncbi:hypothetical protein MN608_10993 [Microdochium nivale]|nr:hypothetical protein MN608_10993 [Microdochium nivale]